MDEMMARMQANIGGTQKKMIQKKIEKIDGEITQLTRFRNKLDADILNLEVEKRHCHWKLEHSMKDENQEK